MEHDRKCEADAVFGQVSRELGYGSERSGRDSGDERLVLSALKALYGSDQMCACLARAWGLEVPLKVGMKIGTVRARKYLRSWLKTGPGVQDERIKQMVERAQGKNVIDIGTVLRGDRSDN